jgi:hypothetical protein
MADDTEQEARRRMLEAAMPAGKNHPGRESRARCNIDKGQR